MAVRIEHRDAVIPDPSEELLTQMATAGFASFKESYEAGDSGLNLGDWDGVSEETRDRWMCCARQMYGIVAMFGGASAEKIREH